jgi:hypothetical protein
MSEIKRFNPDLDRTRQERIRYFVELFQRGLKNEKIIAYHGTSIEVVKDIIDTGKIMGGFGGHKPEEVSVLPPQISIFLKDPKINPSNFVEESEKADEKLYARTIAEDHGMATVIGVDFRPRELPEPMSRKIVNNARWAVRKRKGVILGFDKKILDDFQQRSPDEQGERGEVIIECPNGIDYKYIVGLEAQGQYERDYFMNLYKSVNA